MVRVKSESYQKVIKDIHGVVTQKSAYKQRLITYTLFGVAIYTVILEYRIADRTQIVNSTSTNIVTKTNGNIN